jgi:hypothetical protein
VIFDSDSNLKKIGEYGFQNCGIRSIRIPNKVEKIGSYCFAECESLGEVVFDSGSNLQTIGSGAFRECHNNVCVIVPRGFRVRYEWPRGCHVEYFD